MALGKDEVLINVKRITRKRLKEYCRLYCMTYDEFINDALEVVRFELSKR